MEDLTKALTYEIKQDIANRYFGFRKRIETESNQYLQNLQTAATEYTVAIKTDVQRMHCLLKRDELFRSFFKFTKLPETFECFDLDPESPSQWRQLFENLKGEGLTRRWRYRNLVYKIYNSLTTNINTYQDMFTQLEEEHEDICYEIKTFYRSNDLSGILNFLREIDNPDALQSGLLQTDRVSFTGHNMDQELRIAPPPSVSTSMYPLVRLPLLKEAKPTLNMLLKQAYPLFDHCSIEKLPF